MLPRSESCAVSDEPAWVWILHMDSYTWGSSESLSPTSLLGQGKRERIIIWSVKSFVLFYVPFFYALKKCDFNTTKSKKPTKQQTIIIYNKFCTLKYIYIYSSIIKTLFCIKYNQIKATLHLLMTELEKLLFLMRLFSTPP